MVRHRKSIWQNPWSISDQNSQQTRNGRELQPDGIYKKHTAYIILNIERINVFPLRSGTTQGLHMFTRTKRKEAGIHIKKRQCKTLFIDDTITYIENLMKATIAHKWVC